VDPLSFVIAFAGLVVGAAGTSLAYLERTKSYRDVLHKTQLEAAVDLIDATQLLYRRVDDAVMMNRLRATGLATDANALWLEARDARYALRPVERRTTLVLGSASLGALAKYHEALNGVMSFYGTGFETTLTGVRPDPSDMAKLRKAFEDLVRATRDDLGVDALSSETLGLIGRSENKPDASG
jgi:hypothetical protein